MNTKLITTSCSQPIPTIKRQIYDSSICPECTGKGVTICYVSSGVPITNSVKNITAFDVMTDNKEDLPDDEMGHSSILAGFATSSHKQLQGIAPDVKLMFAKSFHKKNNTTLSSIIAAILWGIVKDANIIVLPITIKTDFMPLKNSIEKAISQNILIVTDYDNYFPSKYEGVLSFASSKKTTKTIEVTSIKNNKILLSLPKIEYYTLYNNNTFVSVNTKTASLSLGTGILARIIESLNKNKIKITPETIIKKLN